MRPRKSMRRKDWLGIALKTMGVNETLVCTDRTLANIGSRLEVFFKVQPDRTYRTFRLRGEENVNHIKRMA